MLKKVFSVQSMIKPEQCLGTLPPSKKVYQDFLRVAWPSAVESVLVGLIGSVDTIMVGGIGTAAIAAVGITNQPKFILLAAIFSLNVGVTAIVSRRKGQNDRDGANFCLRQCLLLCASIAFIMAVLGYAFADTIMTISGATQDYIAEAVIYFRILMISIFFQAINLTINAAQRGVGNTRISMWTNIAGNLVNLIFNFLLINGIGFFPRLEVRGAAIATVLGSIVACCISLCTLLYKEGFLSLRIKGRWRPNKKSLSTIFNISGSALVEQVFIRVGFFLYNIMVAKLGTTAYATHLICNNIINLSFNFGDGFGVAASSLAGQSLGAKRPDHAIIYGKTGQRLVFCISSILCIFFVTCRFLLMGLFTSEPEVIELGSIIILIIAFVTYLQTSQVVISGCLRGAGDTKFVALTSFVSITIIRPYLTWLFCFAFHWGVIGAWASLVVDQAIRLIFNFTRFSSGKWTKINI